VAGTNASLQWMCDDFIGRGEVSEHDGKPPLPLNAFCHLPHPDAAATDDALGGGDGDGSGGDEGGIGGGIDGGSSGGSGGSGGGGGHTHSSSSAAAAAPAPAPAAPASVLPLHSLASLRVRVVGLCRCNKVDP
jgi:hypothetical protein